jgi:small GTP-binding protein
MKLFNLKINEIDLLRKEISRTLVTNPPTIGLVGVSGVGKSTTINTLFKTNLPVSDTVACTKEFQTIPLDLKFDNENIKNFVTKLWIIDAPGLGEDTNFDADYIRRYKENLKHCDVILWIMTGKNRAIALDQQYLKELLDFHSKIIFGINQVELIEPQDWNTKINLPSKRQMENIKIIEQDRKEKIEKILQRKIRICSYSAKTKYNLEELFSLLINSCSESRKWIFNGLKGFHYTDFLPENIREQFKTEGK